MLFEQVEPVRLGDERSYPESLALPAVVPVVVVDGDRGDEFSSKDLPDRPGEGRLSGSAVSRYADYEDVG